MGIIWVKPLVNDEWDFEQCWYQYKHCANEIRNRLHLLQQVDAAINFNAYNDIYRYVQRVDNDEIIDFDDYDEEESGEDNDYFISLSDMESFMDKLEGIIGDSIS